MNIYFNHVNYYESIWKNYIICVTTINIMLKWWKFIYQRCIIIHFMHYVLILNMITNKWFSSSSLQVLTCKYMANPSSIIGIEIIWVVFIAIYNFFLHKVVYSWPYIGMDSYLTHNFKFLSILTGNWMKTSCSHINILAKHHHPISLQNPFFFLHLL